MSSAPTDDIALFEPFHEPDVDPESFERYCRTVAEKWAKGALKGPFRIEYRAHEPIDILIEEDEVPTISGLSNVKPIAGEGRAPRHFIECKLRGRELGLNVVGAPYLYAFRERPSSLVFATNRELTGGAREFASWLFNVQMGKMTQLYLWNPFDSEEPKRAAEEEDASSDVDWNVHRPPIAIDRWTLRERTPFQDIPVASSDDESRKEYSLRLDGILVFHVFLSNSVRGRKVKSARLRIGTAEHDIVSIQLEEVANAVEGLEMQGIIRANDLVAGVTYPPADLDVIMSGGQDSWCRMQDFPRLYVEPKAIVLPDLRNDETNSLYERWMRTNDTRILLIQGEGGAGKTYLSERMAIRAAHAGFRAAHTPLEVRTELAFVAEITWLLLSPDVRALLKETDRALTTTLLAELGAAYGTLVTEGDAMALTTLLLDGRWAGSSPEVLLQTIARLIVYSQRPLLFIISNAHRLSDSVSYGMRILLGAIEAAGWGQIRLIVEARDTPEDLGDNWLNLKTWMTNALGHRITEYTVRPLDKVGLRKSLAGFIASTDDELMARLIAEKSGGNPLFLRHLLQSLLEQDVIEPLPSGLATGHCPIYALPSISKLRTAVAKIGINVEELIVGRIQFWDDRLRSSARGWAGYVLGLMSILEDEVPVALLATLTARSPEAIETTLMSFDMAGLVFRRPNEAFCLSHEFAARAARTWLQAQTDVYARIAEIADYPVSVADTDAFAIALGKGRLHAFLRRNARALDALNTALQLAGGNFENTFRCRRDIHNVLAEAAVGSMARPFHENLREYMNVGYYILPCDKNIELNKKALAAIQDSVGSSLSRAERKVYAGRYHHNLSNLGLRSLDAGMFFEHSRIVLESCSTPLEMARFLNRAIKICTITGAVGIGRRLGEIALSLQPVIASNDDPDLESVLLGEMSFLYARVSPRIASELAEEAVQKGVSERQRAHNLFARACARLRLGETDAGASDFKAFEGLVTTLALKAMSSGVDMLGGILALFRSDWREAATFFRMGMADTAWLGYRREELRIGTNLVAARALACDLESASRLNDVLLSIAARLCRESFVQPLEDMLRRSHFRANVELGWNGKMKPASIFPETIEIGPHLAAPLLHNAEALHRHFPKMFSAPSCFGFTDREIEQQSLSTPEQIVFRSDSHDLALHVAC